MYILGINGGISWLDNNRFNLKESQCHDAAAVLLCDGKIVAAFEEERLNRIKHTNKLPVLSITACLKSAGIVAADLDAIVIASEEALLDEDIKQLCESDKSFNFASAREFLTETLKKEIGVQIDEQKLLFVNHHLAHAASSYFLSGYNDSVIIAVDGSGDNYSGGVYIGKNNDISLQYNFPEQDSIGHFYLAVTRLLGFKRFDEYKVMGLAPYGDPERYAEVFDSLYSLGEQGAYKINKAFMDNLAMLLPSRKPREKINQEHMDVAAALQVATEKLVFHIASYCRDTFGLSNLCLCGGVALNCTMTGKLKYSGMFDNIFVQPASHDGGLALGAALWIQYNLLPAAPRQKLNHLYLGTACPSEQEAMAIIDSWKNFINYETSENVTGEVAKLLSENKIVGWFQGQSEYGPRALGNRSILGDPRPAENKSRINKCIKNRENFRPFAPSVLVEHAREIFELPDSENEYPYMIFILNVQQGYQKRLGAVTHVDGTARVQTVSKKSNTLYYDLIESFYKLTGVPVILNTSFNNNYEPIVDTPDEAITCFLTSELDALAINNIILRKKNYTDNIFLELYPGMPRFVTLNELEEEGKICYKLGNTYNENQLDISADMFWLLSESDFSKSLNELMGKCSEDQKNCLIEEILALWNTRSVILLPRERALYAAVNGIALVRPQLDHLAADEH